MDNLLHTFRAHLEQGGLADGLRFLNERVPHRFTGVYRLRDGTLHSVGLFDKLNEVLPEGLKAVPLGDSFCQFVLRDGGFSTACTAQDERLNGHVYQGVVGSYIGLPLTHRGDDLQGTLCHFDFEDRAPVSEDEYAFLNKAALLLPRFLPSS